VAGPEGTVLIEVMMGDHRSWGDRPELFHEALAARGAEPLPDAAIELPEWLEDLRSRWVVVGEPIEESRVPDPAPRCRSDHEEPAAALLRRSHTKPPKMARARTGRANTAGTSGRPLPGPAPVSPVVGDTENGSDHT